MRANNLIHLTNVLACPLYTVQCTLATRARLEFNAYFKYLIDQDFQFHLWIKASEKDKKREREKN